MTFGLIGFVLKLNSRQRAGRQKINWAAWEEENECEFVLWENSKLNLVKLVLQDLRNLYKLLLLK